MIRTFDTTRWPADVREKLLSCAIHANDHTITIDLSSDCYRAIRARHIAASRVAAERLRPVERAIVDLLAKDGPTLQNELPSKLGIEMVNPAVVSLLRTRRVRYCSGCRAKLTLV